MAKSRAPIWPKQRSRLIDAATRYQAWIDEASADLGGTAPPDHVRELIEERHGYEIEDDAMMQAMWQAATLALV